MGKQAKKSKEIKKSEKKAKPDTNGLNNNMLLTTQKWILGRVRFP